TPDRVPHSPLSSSPEIPPARPHPASRHTLRTRLNAFPESAKCIPEKSDPNPHTTETTFSSLHLFPPPSGGILCGLSTYTIPFRVPNKNIMNGLVRCEMRIL